jgi:hypothetical protein
MSQSSHHHHHHHKEDDAGRFRDHNLRMISLRRQLEKWLKVSLCILALLMGALVVYLYLL